MPTLILHGRHFPLSGFLESGEKVFEVYLKLFAPWEKRRLILQFGWIRIDLGRLELLYIERILLLLNKHDNKFSHWNCQSNFQRRSQTAKLNQTKWGKKIKSFNFYLWVRQVKKKSSCWNSMVEVKGEWWKGICVCECIAIRLVGVRKTESGRRHIK